jgi:hypothetical protein
MELKMLCSTSRGFDKKTSYGLSNLADALYLFERSFSTRPKLISAN